MGDEPAADEEAFLDALIPGFIFTDEQAIEVLTTVFGENAPAVSYQVVKNMAEAVTALLRERRVGLVLIPEKPEGADLAMWWVPLAEEDTASEVAEEVGADGG